MEKDKIYKPVKEYADLLGLTVQAIYKQIKSGKLKSKKIGTYTLVEVE